MKIAVRFFFAVALGLLGAGITQAYAQALVSESAAVQAIDAGTRPVPGELSVDKALSQEGSDSIAMPQKLAVDEPKEAESSKGEGLKSPKVPDSVVSVINKLNTTSTNTTLDDLNTAREAVAKLDVLIDIEKRLNDLAKLRKARAESRESMVSPIPASSLLPSGVDRVQASSSSRRVEAAPVMSSSSMKVDRIYGANGRYQALIDVGSGKSVPVKEGDKISDGSVVQSISKNGVVLVKDKKTRTIKVNDMLSAYNSK